MTDGSEESRGVQRRAEWYRAAFWSTQQHGQQFLSPQQLSSLKQLHFPQTYWEGAPGCYSNLLCFGINSSLQVSLSVRLSVQLCPDLSNTLPHSATHSQTACLSYYIMFWYQAGNDTKMRASSKSIFLHSRFPFKSFILILNVPHHRRAG